MTNLLKPLLQTPLPQPVLAAMMPNFTPPPGLLAPPPATPCPLQRPDTQSLLDGGDMEGVDLPGCLLPTPHSPKKPGSSQLAPPQPPPKPPEATITLQDTSNHSSPEDGLQLPPSRHASSSNGIFLPPLQNHPSLVSHTPSPSLSFSMSLSSSPSLSPCQGPHLSRPGSCASRGLLPSASSQDALPPLSSHCSAPPSLTSSPGDHRLRLSPPVRLLSPAASPHPSTVSLPVSLDFVSAVRRQRDAQTPPRCKSQLCHGEAGPVPHPQELEMQERGPQVEQGKSSAERISFIDEEEPAL